MENKGTVLLRTRAYYGKYPYQYIIDRSLSGHTSVCRESGHHRAVSTHAQAGRVGTVEPYRFMVLGSGVLWCAEPLPAGGARGVRAGSFCLVFAGRGI